MKRNFLIPASLALAASAALLGACKATDTAGNLSAGVSRAAGKTATTGTTEVHADGVRRVGPAELKQMLEDGRAVLYDTRAKASYDHEHIKGSLSMPHEEVASRAGEFPKDKTLVFYCT
jgi:3-mercaptopyruvate sulfurtransferase SseA